MHIRVYECVSICSEIPIIGSKETVFICIIIIVISPVFIGYVHIQEISPLGFLCVLTYLLTEADRIDLVTWGVLIDFPPKKAEMVRSIF